MENGRGSGGTSSSGVITYKVKKGDTLGKIASKYRVTVNQLKSWNHLRSTNISIGQKIKVYKGGATNASLAASAAAKELSYTEYTVKAGDSLYSISKKFPGTTPEKIMKFNGISDNIKPGMRLRIPR